MPVTGAKSEIASLKGLANEVRAAISETRTLAAQEMAAFAREVRENGQLLVRKIKEERAEAMTEFSDMLGNERAGDDDSKG